MKYGIISDIHSNLEAFEEVLGFLENRVDQIICLGDIIGYGPNPNECASLVRINKFPCVAGNHEYGAENIIGIENFNPLAAVALNWTCRGLSAENFNFIRTLPPRMEFEDFEIVHGSLKNPVLEYITNIETAAPTFKLMKTPLLFAGHTHRPAVMSKNNGKIEGFSINGEGSFSIGENQKTIFNAGSVGQPRDGNPQAACAIYDTNRKEVFLHRVSYDISRTQGKMQKAGLPQRLIDRLKTGS